MDWSGRGGSWLFEYLVCKVLLLWCLCERRGMWIPGLGYLYLELSGAVLFVSILLLIWLSRCFGSACRLRGKERERDWTVCMGGGGVKVWVGIKKSSEPWVWNLLWEFVAGIRLELMTSGLWIQRSNQLSYPAIYLFVSLEKRLQKY